MEVSHFRQFTHSLLNRRLWTAPYIYVYSSPTEIFIWVAELVSMLYDALLVYCWGCFFGVFFLYIWLLHRPWSNALISPLDSPLHLSPSPSYHQALSVSPSPPSWTSLPLISTITPISLSFLHRGCLKNPPTQRWSSHAWSPCIGAPAHTCRQ